MVNDSDVIGALDIPAEYAAMGVRMNGQAASADGWMSVHAIGREDRNASAAINLQTGRYKDHGGDGESLSFFDFAAKYGNLGDWRKARDHFAEKAGLKRHKGKVSKSKAAKKEQLAKNAQKIEAILPQSTDIVLGLLAKAKPPITLEGIKQCGGVPVRWFNTVCVRFDGRDPINNTEPTAIVLCRNDGKPFPAWKTIGERKTHTIGGSVNSWLCSGTVEKLQQAATILDVEGITDWLAVVSAGLSSGWVAVTNTAGAKARGSLPRDWARDKKIMVFGDADKPGVTGQHGAAAAYYQAGAAEILLATLPYPVEENHGKDLRDWLNEGHTVADLPTVAVTAEEATTWVTKPTKARTDRGRPRIDA